ncbi:MAG: signal recognition particle-docking protein FtsY [Deltaproteobacteria bacterium]|nr:signal recognition particle-docking protein FtsY [Deltaproteobacteria bacterium]
MSSIFKRLKDGLAKSTQKIVSQIDDTCNPEVSREDQLVLLEEALITSDLGVNAALAVVDNIRDSEFTRDPKELRQHIREAVFSILEEVEKPLVIDKRPFVIMALGVNGVGKTTTIGKLASRYTREGHKVFLAAADTFRAAAIEQLMAWGEKTRCEIIRQEQGGDPGAVAFDAVRAGIARRADIVILDTAGRLHTKVNLMEELKKIKRVVERVLPDAPHENLLVLDASTGQNAINQAHQFHEAVGVTGMSVAKLDGTAKGGIIVAIAKEFSIPIRFIGVGEQVDDLRDFDAREFVDALF